MDFDLNQLYGLAGIPIISALIQLVKITIPELPDRFWPLASVAIAMAFNVLLGWRLGGDVFIGAILGLVVGLASSGLYSQTKTAVRG